MTARRVPLVVALLSLLVSALEIAVPRYVGFYDSGVYLIAANHFVAGLLPYRDFLFVQPPGGLVLFAPLGVVSHVAGYHAALVAGRWLIAVVWALVVFLVGRLALRRGAYSALVAGVVTATAPAAFSDSTWVKLEPVTLALCLGAAVLVLPSLRSGLLRSRRLWFAGLLVGFGAGVKLWAAFAFVGLAVAAWSLYRRSSWRLWAGAALGFLGVVGPFFAAAPGSFWRMVVLDQLHRRAMAGESLGLFVRVDLLLGFPPGVGLAGWVTLVALVLLVGLVVSSWRRGWLRGPYGRFVLVSVVSVALMLLVSRESFPYYYAFFVPYFALLLGASLGPRLALARVGRLVAVLVAGAVVLCVALYGVVVRSGGYDPANLAPLASLIPVSACVVYSVAAYGVQVDRVSDPRTCPDVLDSYATWFAAGYQTLAVPPAFQVRRWESWLARARFFVLPSPRASNVPWSPRFDGWLRSHFVVRFDGPQLVVWERLGVVS